MHLLLVVSFASKSDTCSRLTDGMAVFPSELATSLISHATMDPREEGAFDKSYIPAERTGDEEDMAGAILFLTSRAGAYLNGNVLLIVSRPASSRVVNIADH